LVNHEKHEKTRKRIFMNMNESTVTIKKGGRAGKSNCLAMITVTPTKAPVLSDADWRGVLAEWFQMRSAGGMGSVESATKLGYRVSVLERVAKRLGLKVPDECKRKMGRSAESLKLRETRAAQYADFCGMVEGGMGVTAAARKVGVTLRMMMDVAKVAGVKLGVRVGGVEGSMVEGRWLEADGRDAHATTTN